MPAFVDREGEERVERGKVSVDEVRIDAVVDELEEADLVADLPESIGELGAVGAGRRPPRQRHDRDLVERHARDRTADVERPVSR